MMEIVQLNTFHKVWSHKSQVTRGSDKHHWVFGLAVERLWEFKKIWKCPYTWGWSL